MFNLVTGLGETCGDRLVKSPLVDKVAFTGSTEVGKMIARAATGNLKKVSLELGGKAPTIVLADADVEMAVAGASSAAFFNAGQSCGAKRRTPGGLKSAADQTCRCSTRAKRQTS